MRRLQTRPWLAALVVYALSRVVSTVLLGTMFTVATVNHWAFASHRAHASLITFSASWDSSAYKGIAEHGYPTALPVDAAGHVLPNAWAFLPVFPAIVRALTTALGLNAVVNGYYTVAVVTATLFGAGAVLMLSAMLRQRVSNERALFAVVLFCMGPMGFLLQAAYAESAFLFFLFAALWCLQTSRYLLLVPFAVVAAFTRPGVLALALTLGIHFVVRIRERRIGTARFPLRDAVSIGVAALVTAVAGLAWPVVASAVTGRSSAYLDTELAFWVGFVGHRHFAPLTPWFAMATTFLGPVGIVVVVLALAAAAFWLTRRGTKALGHEIVGFTASYWLYLVAVFLPQQSLVRLLMPAAPMLGSPVFWGPGVAGSRRRRILLVAGAILLQAVAIVFLWFLGYP
ncbi:hypothetical protein AX769_06655 [Frondihabitans sp. PAMC 28766]|uniref:mannosyltransferase family protein n=1 Tax=Frondihabitans sp. PAMC 28766 TaxID=1795630 RepID=UPI00078B3897|nr:mannosyltransferase family protein [Frondihabitans sp. PAMC 28766]AMM19894.1 hypothetical protein AX769_06655 [Frondihabitans sp. PAMC 28766]